MLAATPLRLRTAERAALEEIAGGDNRSSALAVRAQIVLRAAAGAPNTAIARELGVSRPTVIAWRQRYVEVGLPGLRDLPRPGRPRDVNETRVVTATFTRPPARSAVRHWSTRTLSDAIGVNHSSIADVWRRWGLRPGSSTPLAIPSQPPLSPWVRDVVGIYLNPPEYALAVIVDAVAANATIEALQTVGHPSADMARRVNELLGAMTFATDRLDENCPPLLAHEQLIEFLSSLARAHPRRTVHLLLRNASSIDHPEMRYWLARRPSFHLHLAPESPDWFAAAHVLMSFAALNAGSSEPVATTQEIVAAMRGFASDWDEGHAHFSWLKPLTPSPSERRTQRA